MTATEQPHSLKSRILRGGTWLTIGTGAEQGLRFARNIILARLLAPEAFGVMAIVLAVDTFLESFTELGIKEAIVQNPKSKKREYLNGAWWVCVLRSVILYAVVFCFAPYVGDFYRNPDLVPLMRVAFLSVVFKGLMSANAYIALKEMHFRNWMVIQSGGGALGVMTAVVLAFEIRDVWALAIGFTVEAFGRFLLSYVVCPFRPGVTFDKVALGSLVRYSRGMLGLPILTFIFMRIDIFVIGKLCPMTALGLYSMANSLARMPAQFIASILGQLMMPVFSKIQTDKAKTNSGILRVTAAMMFIGFPLLFLAILYGGELLTLAYGPQYGSVAIPFAIVFGVELLRIGGTPLATFYLQSGRPALHRFFAIMRTALILVLIFPAVKWLGLVGAAGSAFISMAIALVFQARRTGGLTGLDLKKYFCLYWWAALTAVPVVIIWFFSGFYRPVNPMLRVAFGALGCFVSYCIATWTLMKAKIG